MYARISTFSTGVLIPEYYAETLSSTIYTSWTDMVRLGLEIGMCVCVCVYVAVCVCVYVFVCFSTFVQEL